jgi:hypothetical protein
VPGTDGAQLRKVHFVGAVETIVTRTSTTTQGKAIKASIEGGTSNENVPESSANQENQERSKRWPSEQNCNSPSSFAFNEELFQRNEEQDLAQLADGRKLSLLNPDDSKTTSF